MLFIFLAGCQSGNLNLDKEVTHIDVYNWEGNELAVTITDRDFINRLETKLEQAEKVSTATMDFANPDYLLHLKNDEETLYEMGYYKAVMKLDIPGRYWDFQEDELYGVKLELQMD